MQVRHGAGGRATVRVLYVQPCASFGGAERQAAGLIPLLGEWDIDVLPFVGPSETVCRWLADRGVGDTLVSQSFPGPWSEGEGLSRLLRPVRYLSARREVADEVEALVREREIDIVYAASPFAWLAATEPSRRLGVPVVWRAGAACADALERVLLRTWARLYPPDLLLCCSEAVKARLEPLVDAPAEVVRNGVELDRFRAGRGSGLAHRPPSAPLVVGFAAPLLEGRGVYDFIEMAAALAQRRPNLVFAVAGDGSQREAAEALAEARGIGGRVRFLGFLEEMPSFYASCDVIALPGAGDGCPNALLEAMAMQRAVVVSDAVASGAGLRHEREALVFQRGDREAFVAAVERVVDSETLRGSLARAGCQMARREHDVRVSARRLARALRMVAAMSGLRVMPEARRELLQSMNG